MQNLYGVCAARPRSLPHGGEGNFARIRPKDSADTEILWRTRERAIAVRNNKGGRETFFVQKRFPEKLPKTSNN